ncbi:MAG: hypothetical protein AMXMBFR23_14040 [Chloroflexota bacterium]
MLPARRLLVGVAALLALAVLVLLAWPLVRDDAGDGASVVDATATPEASASAVPTASPEAGIAADAAVAVAPAQVAIDPPEVGQGESALVIVRQPGAASGSLLVFGKHYPLRRSGEVLWAVFGAGLATPTGATTLTVTTRDESGAVLGTADAPFSVGLVDRPVDYLELTEEQGAVLTPEAAATEARLRTYEQFNAFDGAPAWDGLFIRPADGIVTTEFGQGRSINGGPVGGFHSGLDIANAEGTPIVAPAPGRVVWAGPMPIRGVTVLLDHGAGVVTGYHHLLEARVPVGTRVEAGEVIALMGSTGLSTGPHLHWEMTIYGVNVDPDTWTRRSFLPE